jgi:formylglycine-generating enzyme
MSVTDPRVLKIGLNYRCFWSFALLGLVVGCGQHASKREGPSSSASAAVSATPSSAPGASESASAAPIPSASAPPELEDEDLPEPEVMDKTIPEQRATMLRRMRAMGVATEEQTTVIEQILSKTKWAGQGNPAASEHPFTRDECMQRRKAAGLKDEKKSRCKAPFMVPVYDPAKETEDQAKVCIDRYEFPDLPCDYPMTWVTTNQAEDMCKAIGKRICDAHEWEGACAGALRSPDDDYTFNLPRKTQSGLHNQKREIIWAYGKTKDHTKCGTGSHKSKKCTPITWEHCGSNTYPAGSFPECRSPLGVYDQHGNAAEQMALPLKAEELGSRGGFGVPEMKGSWFIFQEKEAHLDDCRWRAPAWHDNEGKNHRSYHLGFRCCKDITDP